jgi:arylsulfatase A-like enzyme
MKINKLFLQNWLLPPAFFNLLKKVKLYLSRDNQIDKRRYWLGENISSPLQNVPYFGDLSSKSESVTLHNETRDCLLLRPGESITTCCTKDDVSEWNWKLSFSSINLSPVGDMVVESNSKVIGSLSHLMGMKWNTIKIPDGAEHLSLSIFNRTNSDVYVSHPCREAIYKNDEDGLQNVVVLILDSLWRDKIGIYNENDKEDSPTPFIDKFFSNGLRYWNCFSSAEWTLPSVYSMLTTQYPVNHGRTDYRSFTPEFGGERHPSFVAALAKKGFSTMACSGAKVFTPAFSGHIGFNRFFYDSYPESGRTDGHITKRAIDHLRSNEDGKNFLYLHYIDTHDGWIDPSYAEESQLDPIRVSNPLSEFMTLKEASGATKGEPTFGKEQIKLLDKRLAQRLNEVDLSLQSLFAYLDKSGLASTTAVLLCADHGFQYTGRGRPLLSDTRVNVPLLIKHPKFEGEDIKSLVNLGLDIGPTISQILNVDFPTKEGKVLSPIGNSKPRDRVIIESIFGDRYKVCIRTEKYVFHQHVKYNRETHTIDMGSEIEVFLFVVGNEELNHDLTNSKPEVVAEMRTYVIEHLNKSADEILWKQ